MAWQDILKRDKYAQEYMRLKELQKYFDNNGTESFWNAYTNNLQMKEHNEAVADGISTIRPSNPLDKDIFFNLLTSKQAFDVLEGKLGNNFLEEEIEHALDQMGEELSVRDRGIYRR